MIRSLLKPGDHVVVPTDAYGGTYRYFNKVAKDKFFPAEEAGVPADIALLEEIRDLLASRPGQV